RRRVPVRASRTRAGHPGARLPGTDGHGTDRRGGAAGRRCRSPGSGHDRTGGSYRHGPARFERAGAGGRSHRHLLPAATRAPRSRVPGRRNDCAVNAARGGAGRFLAVDGGAAQREPGRRSFGCPDGCLERAGAADRSARARPEPSGDAERLQVQVEIRAEREHAGGALADATKADASPRGTATEPDGTDVTGAPGGAHEPNDPGEPPSELTDREREIVRLLRTGASNAAIARDLYLSEATIKGHVSRLMRRHDCGNRTQLALLATRWSL